MITLTLALSREWIAPEALQTLVTLPAVRVAHALQALAGPRVAPVGGVGVGVATAVARLAKVTNGQRVAKEAVAATLAMGAGVAPGAGRANVLVRAHGVLVKVLVSHLARGTKVVAGHVGGALAWLAIVRGAIQRVAIVAELALLTLITFSVVKTCLKEGMLLTKPLMSRMDDLHHTSM